MSKLQRQRGTTLVESIVAICVIGVTSALTIPTLISLNNRAALSRLKTGAGTVAQNQIDSFLSLGPYSPQKSQIPAELEIGRRSIGSASNPTVPIYTDPATNEVVVYGWINIDVKDTQQGLGTANFQCRSADVTVNYVFRGTTHSVTMSTMRVSDT